MTKHETGILTFKALSIYALIRGAEQVQQIVRVWPQGWPRENDSLISHVMIYYEIFAPLLIFIIFSLALWKLSPRFVTKMFTSDQTTDHPAFTTPDALSLVFTGFGLYLLVNTIPGVMQSLFSVYASLSMQLDYSTHTQVNILRLTTVVRLAVGCWLLFGSKGLSNILSKMRNA